MNVSKPIRTFTALFFGTFLTACQMPSFVTPPTLTPTQTILPTNTLTATYTLTRTPSLTFTFTPSPSRTLNSTATAAYSAMTSTVKNLYEMGYIPDTNGTYFHLADYSHAWAQISWYSWQEIKHSPKDFIIKSHMAWQSASKTPNPSGCGIVFHLQPNREQDVIFVKSDGTVEFGIYTDYFHSQGKHYYGNPANQGDVDFLMLVLGTNVVVFVNGNYIYTYSTLQGKMQDGRIAFTTLSGTNADYGTRCTITQADLWMINP
jgi:hypothetical protein